jgi:hypothetical protein
MNDAGQAIRKAYFAALNNQVGNPENAANKIPVVDEKLDLNITDHDLYILIGGQAENLNNVKNMWAKECDISLTVVNRRKSTNSKTYIENISDQILTILFPTRTTNGLTVTSPFKLTYARLTSAQYAFDKSNDGWQISKTLVFRNHITQS